jgi:chemotaxis protein MotB
VVNEGKFRVMSESIVEAFNGSSHVIAPMPPTRVRPHNVQPAIAAPAGQPGSSIVPIAVPIPPHPVPMHGEGSGAHAGFKRSGQAATPQENLKNIERQVQAALKPLIDKQQVVVRRTEDWLEIEIRTDILFPSGVAELAPPASAVLRSLAGILAPFANPLRVEGYTDDVPIKTLLYPSNWELSAARAATVARLFAEHGVSADRLGIIGWGEVRPLADNATAEGRNLNRRVLVVVLSDRSAPSRFYSDPHPLDARPLDAAPMVAMDEAAIPHELPTARVTASDGMAAADGTVAATAPAGPKLGQAAVATVLSAEVPSAEDGTTPATAPAAMPAAGVMMPAAGAAPMDTTRRRSPSAAPLR